MPAPAWRCRVSWSGPQVRHPSMRGMPGCTQKPMCRRPAERELRPPPPNPTRPGRKDQAQASPPSPSPIALPSGTHHAHLLALALAPGLHVLVIGQAQRPPAKRRAARPVCHDWNWLPGHCHPRHLDRGSRLHAVAPRHRPNKGVGGEPAPRLLPVSFGPSGARARNPRLAQAHPPNRLSCAK